MADKARRRRLRLRLAAGTAFVALAAVAITIGVSRQQAVRSRDRAAAEALRAEAGKLLALGQTHLEDDPTAALAYARGSLELFDTLEARALRRRGPVARARGPHPAGGADGAGAWTPGGPEPASEIVLSPDGRWLATRSGSNRRILIFPRDGGPARALPRPPDGNTSVLEFGPRGDLLITGGSGESLRFWSLPDLREIRSAELGGLRSFGWVRGGRLLTFTRMHEERPEFLMRAWPLPDGEPKVLGTFSLPGTPWDLDPSGTTIAYARGRTVRVRPLDPRAPRRSGSSGARRDEVQDVTFAPRGDRLASVDRSGEIRVWSTAGGARLPSAFSRVPVPGRSLRGSIRRDVF